MSDSRCQSVGEAGKCNCTVLSSSSEEEVMVGINCKTVLSQVYSEWRDSGCVSTDSTPYVGQ